MSQRVLQVTAYTTFDYLQGEVTGIDWKNEGITVLDVDAVEEEGHVKLSMELDPMDLERVEQHADHAKLYPDEARTLASTLREAADRVEEATENLSDDD